ncbi:hypothetical protein [Nocardia sp. NPDC020380]|uniref:hypothetical protein n=1 Tax=Nocardia sp. NPDC020380 TaxID=3364309 RepID=UPI0037AA98FC
MELFELWGAAAQIPTVTMDLLREADAALADAARDLNAFEAIAESTEFSPERPPAWEWASEPGIAGFWGVGLWMTEDGHGLHPAVFVDSGLNRGQPGLFTSWPDELDYRMRAVGMPATIRETGLLPIGRDRAQLQHCAPGDEVRVPGQRSTLGCRVTLANGRRGVTTAGHATSAIGITAQVHQQRIGRVVDIANPLVQPAGTAGPDIALIELDSKHSDRSTPTYTGYATIAPGDKMVVNVRGGAPQSVWARAVMPTLWLAHTHGAWSTVIETDRPVTGRGDSGTPVETDSRPGYLTGHVVAGDAVRTIVQDLDYQLRHFNAQLRP